MHITLQFPKSKARFTIYVNADAAYRNDVAGIELKSILTYSSAITPAERQVYVYCERSLGVATVSRSVR